MATKKKTAKKQTKVKKSTKAKKLTRKFSPKPKRASRLGTAAPRGEAAASPSPFPITPSP